MTTVISYPYGVGSTTTRIIEAGQGDRCILLLHGFTSRADRWRGNIEQLAQLGFRVVAADLPGHGFATKNPVFDHSVTGYRMFVQELLDLLEIRRAVMVGTSLGGHVLADLTCRDPERVEKLVMVGSMGLRALPRAQIDAINAGLEDMSAVAVRNRLLSVFTDPALVTDALVCEDTLVNTSPGAQECLQSFGRYLKDRFNDELVLERLAEIDGQVPLLLLWGEHDTPAPVDIARMAKSRLESARLVVMAGVNHTPYMEKPQLFQTVVESFVLDRLDTLSAADVTIE